MPFLRQRCRGLVPPAAGIVIALGLLFAGSLASASRAQQAAEQYQRAKLLLEDLHSVPQAELGKRQYELVIDAFRKVRGISPESSQSDSALLTAADVCREMVDRFGPARDQQETIQAYQLLIREYPQSKLVTRARKAISEIEAGQFARALPQGKKPAPTEQAPEIERAAASEPLPGGAEAFAGRLEPPPAVIDDQFESSQEQLKVALPVEGVAIRVADDPPPRKMRGSLAGFQEVRHWSNEDYTRVVLELDAKVQVVYNQLANPDRLYFDLFETKLGGTVLNTRAFTVGDGFVDKIRVAQHHRRTTRVVFDLKRPVRFHVSWLANPARFVVELRSPSEAPVLYAQGADKTKDVEPTAPQAAAKITSVESSGHTSKAAEPNFAEALEKTNVGKPAESAPAKVETALKDLPKQAELPEQPKFPVPKPVEPASTPKPENAAVLVAANAPASEAIVATELKAAVEEPLAPTEEVDDLPPPKPAATTALGKHSYIRALGLKVGRVVIDPGHGGHDTGSIGPTGLREKDLVLDIAMRLGELIQQGLGSEVVYTRTNDRFVSLRERTKLANEKKSDLFISVHANSSRTRSANGVETYYLNFTTDSWALQVASRENAAADQSVHELQDLLSKIALKEKIEESREFATQVQKALHSGLAKKSKSVQDRGVRKAPFMVLIGAKMPAILSEIAFLSNPNTEKQLKTSSYRQYLAEHLYQGVLSYANSLSVVSVAKSDSTASKLD